MSAMDVIRKTGLGVNIKQMGLTFSTRELCSLNHESHSNSERDGSSEIIHCRVPVSRQDEGDLKVRGMMKSVITILYIDSQRNNTSRRLTRPEPRQGQGLSKFLISPWHRHDPSTRPRMKHVKDLIGGYWLSPTFAYLSWYAVGPQQGV